MEEDEEVEGFSSKVFIRDGQLHQHSFVFLNNLVGLLVLGFGLEVDSPAILAQMQHILLLVDLQFHQCLRVQPVAHHDALCVVQVHFYLALPVGLILSHPLVLYLFLIDVVGLDDAVDDGFYLFDLAAFDISQ